jgi:NTE family protein
MASRALVLSGGGAVGIAWESGLVGGFAAAGVDLSQADFFLGTSAGSFVGARLALGVSPEELAAPFLAMEEAAPDEAKAKGGASAPRSSGLDVLVRKFIETRQPGDSVRTLRAEIGAFALAAETISEEVFIKSFGRSFSDLPEGAWPKRPFACTAVDTADGVFKLWTQDDGVGVVQAVASSCSVPGVFPPITIAGRRYMDGGVRSSANADHAKGYDRVVVVSVRAGETGPTADVARARLERECKTLTDAGARVEVITPDPASITAFGGDMMSNHRRAAAAKTGYAQGQAGAKGLMAFWAG